MLHGSPVNFFKGSLGYPKNKIFEEWGLKSGIKEVRDLKSGLLRKFRDLDIRGLK